MKLTKTKLKQLIKEEITKMQEMNGAGIHDPQLGPEPGDIYLAPEEEALVAASQMLAAFENGGFGVSLDDAIRAIPQAQADQEARGHGELPLGK